MTGSTVAAGGTDEFLLRSVGLPEGATARALAADNDGNLFVLSRVSSGTSGSQIRATKTDRKGTMLASLDFGVKEANDVSAATVDAQGNLIVAGWTADSRSGSPLIVKLDSALRKTIFAKALGTGSAVAVTTDAAGNIFVTGVTTSFPVTPGAFQTEPPLRGRNLGETFPTGSAAFVAKLSAQGELLFGTYFHPEPEQMIFYTNTSGAAIALDDSGAILIAGKTNGRVPLVPGGPFGDQGCGCDQVLGAGFVSRFSPDGSKLLTSFIFNAGGGGITQYTLSISALALDRDGNIFIAGSAPRAFRVTADAIQASFPVAGIAERGSGFLSKFDPAAAKLLFSTYFGGDVSGLAVDAQNTIWIAGNSDPASALPAPEGTPLLGGSFLASLSGGGTKIASMVTAPGSVAGKGLAIAAGQPVTLGPIGLLLIPSGGAGPSLTGVANAAGASAANVVAGSELVSLYGIGIGPSVPIGGSVVNGVLTTSLGGFQVLFDEVAAPLIFAGPTQINAVVPAAVRARDRTTVRIVSPSGTLEGPALRVTPAQPQVFFAPTNLYPTAVALNEDGTVCTPDNPAPPGSTVTVWATGLGPMSINRPDGAIVTGEIGDPLLPVSVLERFPTGAPIELSYLGDAPSMVAGVVQINFRLPKSTLTSNFVVLLLKVGDALSDAFFIYIKV